MKAFIKILSTASLFVFSSTPFLLGGTSSDSLFDKTELIYEENFDQDGPHKTKKQWVIRQNTQWNVKGGILIGGTATEEFQKKMQAIGDTHDGTRPVIFLKPVPHALVIHMRLKYVGEHAPKSKAQLDLGHHINSFIFGEGETKLTLQKKKVIKIDGDFFPINTWADVKIELTEGKLAIQVNDRREVIEHELITLKTERKIQQIDFKGLDHGEVQIDWVKLYKGIE